MSWMADFQSSLLPADGLGRGAAGFVALAARRGSLERGRVGLGPQADMAPAFAQGYGGGLGGGPETARFVRAKFVLRASGRPYSA
jgi:hypothetical protein